MDQNIAKSEELDEKSWSNEEEYYLSKIYHEVDTLSTEDQIAVLGELLGYKNIPPSIGTFLDDKYYLGEVTESLFPFWAEKLHLIYPTPIHTRYPIVIFKGGIGTGKSTAAKIMAEYQKCRILNLINPKRTFGLMPGKNLKFTFFHKSSALAITDFLQTLNEWEEISPYFKEMESQGRLKGIEQVPDSTRTNSSIGSDVIFYNFSELNFVNYEAAFEKLDQGFKRWDSRFRLVRKYFGHIIVDTSSKEDDSIAEEFAENNPFRDQVLVINTNQWLVREHLNFYGRTGWFKVYLGDGTHSPFIIEGDKILTDEMEHDRVIDVPNELRDNFDLNLVSALQDLAGISVAASDRLFTDKTHLTKCFNLPQYGPEVIKVDFYDKTDKLIYRFNRTINNIPDDKILYARYDIGTTGDNTGLALAYFDSWKTYDFHKNLKQPRIIVPLAVGINRYEGTETPIYHLYEFIMDLKERFEIGGFSADQYGSTQLLQDLKREGVNAVRISVDRTDEAYRFCKILATNELLSFPNHKLLLKEYGELKRIGNKIDHPPTGSKDISDATTGCIWQLYQDIDKASQVSNKNKVKTYAEFMETRTVNNMDSIEEMVRGIY